MSDTRLRMLERRWRETGSQEDHVAFLRERVRAAIAVARRGDDRGRVTRGGAY